MVVYTVRVHSMNMVLGFFSLYHLAHIIAVMKSHCHPDASQSCNVSFPGPLGKMKEDLAHIRAGGVRGTDEDLF
jgi:hypothetical protein